MFYFVTKKNKFHAKSTTVKSYDQLSDKDLLIMFNVKSLPKPYRRLYRFRTFKLGLNYFNRKSAFYIARGFLSFILIMLGLTPMTTWTNLTDQILYAHSIPNRQILFWQQECNFWAILTAATVIIAALVIIFKINWNWRKHLSNHQMDPNRINWKTFRQAYQPKIIRDILDFKKEQEAKH